MKLVDEAFRTKDAHAWPAVPFQIDLSTGRAARRARECRATLEADPPPDAPHEVALRAVLAVSESAIDPQRAAEAMARAEELSAARPSCPSRIYVLLARYAMDLSPDSLEARLRYSEEAWELLRQAGEPLRKATLASAFFMRLGSLIEAGRIAEVDDALSVESHADSHVTPLLHGSYATWFRCLRATLDGQVELAEQLATLGHAQAQHVGDVDADAVRVGQLAIIRWLQGRIAEYEPVFLHLRHSHPSEPVWSASLAWVWLHQGRQQAARSLLDSLPDLRELPRGRNWLAALTIRAEVATQVGSDAVVETLHDALEPFAGRLVPIGLGVSCWGTTDRPLALLALRQGRISDAIAHFRRAIEISARIGAQPWLAQSQLELADLLIDQGREAEAAPLAAEGTAAAEHLQLPALGELGRCVSARLPETGPPGAVVSAPRIAVLGEFMVTGNDGSLAVWRSHKARQLLKILVARRGVALSRDSAMDLLWPGEEFAKLRNRLSAATSTVRRALDPGAASPPDRYVVTTRETVSLRAEAVQVDLEEFFGLVAEARGAGDAVVSDATERALALYRGNAFAEDPDEWWAQAVRDEAHVAFHHLAHEHAAAQQEAGQWREAAGIYRQLVHTDPYDVAAHDGLIRSLGKLKLASQERAARAERDQRRAELQA